MDRRKFLYGVMTGAVGATAGLGLAQHGLRTGKNVSGEVRSVTYQVRGFTCVTCATGLEVILLRQEGVARATASYPEAKVVIGFDDALISEQALKDVITGCGFSVV